MREIKPGKRYRHFKNKIYRVLDIVNDSASNNDEEYSKVVIYQAEYGDNLKWSRPYEEFASLVDREKYPDVEQKYRFEEIEEDNSRELKVGKKYRHFKGTIAEVICVAKHTETEEDLVIYNHEASGKCWARPYHMFLSKVDKDKYPDAMQEYRLEEIDD